MKLKIPKWADGRHVYIFAGREVVARRLWDHEKGRAGPWEKKTIRCNLCGECCRGLDENWPLGVKENGDCAHLRFERINHADGRVEEGYFCKLRGDIVPFTCCKGRNEDPDICCIRFEPVS